MPATVKKWGNSLSVRIPASAARALNLHSGSKVNLRVRQGQLIMEPQSVPSLEVLLSKAKRSNRPELVDFGPAVGKEII